MHKFEVLLIQKLRRQILFSIFWEMQNTLGICRPTLYFKQIFRSRQHMNYHHKTLYDSKSQCREFILKNWNINSTLNHFNSYFWKFQESFLQCVRKIRVFDWGKLHFENTFRCFNLHLYSQKYNAWLINWIIH